MLLEAEQGNLQVELESILISAILDGLRSYFSGYSPDKVHNLIIHNYEQPVSVSSCLPLLLRVLVNMVKNALEDTQPPEQVHVRFEENKDTAYFIVHNPGYIPEAIALQIFKRSFSTKNAHGRGLGTYCMKLFGEQYLKGKVGFSSSENDGTTFYIGLPYEH